MPRSETPTIAEIVGDDLPILHAHLNCGECILESRTSRVSGKFIYPEIAAVTGPILTFAPPAFFGAYSRNWPLPRSIARGPSPTLKIVFSLRQVTVSPLKVSSLRDCTPVCTAVPWRTSSFTAAGRGD